MSTVSPPDATLDGVIWKETLQESVTNRTSVQDDAAVDLVVVGGGFAGLSTALQAAKSGLSVVLLEAGVVGAGASGRNGGFVVPHFPGGLTPGQMSRILGPRKGAALADLVLNGADAVYKTVREQGIACSAEQNGWIQPAHSERSLAKVRAVYEGWRGLGADIRWLDGAEVTTLTGAAGYRGGWTNPTGGTINPYGLVLGLARVAESHGVRIHEASRAERFEPVDGGTVVSVGGHRVKGRTVIVATNGYADAGLPAVQRSAVPVHLFHVATRPLSAKARETVLPTRMCFTDLRKSGGFGRLDSENRLISGGAVFALGDRRAYGLSHVRQRISAVFPSLAAEGFEIETYWEGYCAVTPSFLPHVQVLGRDFLSIGGFSTRGVNLAQGMGRVMGDLAAGRLGLDEVPVQVNDMRKDVPFWALKTRAARLIFPLYQARDRLRLT